MTTRQIRVAFFSAAALCSAATQAQEASSESKLAKYVTVTFEIHGLEESAAILRDAAQSLASAMENLQSGAKDLTPDQLGRIVAVARETNEVVRAVGRTIDESGPAIERARGPTRAMVSDVLSVAKESPIDPTLQSLDRSVTKWLVIAIVGGLVGLFIVMWTFFSIAKQLKGMVGALQSIADEYQIVPRAAPNRLKGQASPGSIY